VDIHNGFAVGRWRGVPRRSSFFSLLLPFASRSELVQLLLLFWSSKRERRAVSVRERERETRRENKREKLRAERETLGRRRGRLEKERREAHLSEACLDTRDAGSNSTVGSGFTKLAISWIILILKPSSAPFLPPFVINALLPLSPSRTDLTLTEKMLLRGS